MENQKMFYIVHKNKNNELEKSSAMSKKDANHYCMCLETLHGVGSHLVVEEDKLSAVDIKNLPTI